MSTPSLTKDDFAKGLSGIREALHAELVETKRDILNHVTTGREQQTAWLKEEFEKIGVKLEAIMSGDVLVTKKQLQRVLQALERRGIILDQKEIFAE